ncbi:methyltransferase type 11 [Mycobacterium stomatepiae]|uniref:Methyltransferase type 11 n=1 Tax=Mycobacterium stomatepiae TaxID=470076 RepID=A0A7I7Q3J9_9MYCO|nr:class I SAM-dependent methyltransferase [Mycobacterium stomatepiae]BBY20652.1 methyltransferase type 11 [Mycobacterium stomatepiae]
MFPYIYRFGQPVFDRLFYNRYRRDAIAHATGRLLMVGLGPGTDMKFVPPAVTSISAVEPVAAFREMASRLASRHGITADIVEGTGESIPFGDNSFDSVHIGLVLCSVEDVTATLAEIRRVLVPDGRLVVLEHVRGEGLMGRLQDLVSKPWSWLAAGCEPNRRTVDSIAAAGFDTTGLRAIPRTPVPFPCKPHLQGFATLIE